jgi:hypothetical protein
MLVEVDASADNPRASTPLVEPEIRLFGITVTGVDEESESRRYNWFAFGRHHEFSSPHTSREFGR